jgi:cytoplasmic FMR1 interacting protein
MDGDGPTSPHNVFKTKKVDLPKLSTWFRKYPVVPLYGDMQQTLDAYLTRSPHFDKTIWGEATQINKTVAVQYEVIHRIEQTRQHYNEYLSKLSSLLIEIAIYKERADPLLFSAELSRHVTLTVQQGILLLSQWTSEVLAQSAYKYASPNTDPNLKVETEYERVVRSNYSDDEKFALIEYIAMIKGLATLLLREETLIVPYVRRFIHWDLQMFLQGECKDAIMYTVKKKKKQKEDFQKMRAIAADWSDGVEPADAYVEKKKDKKADPKDNVRVPNRPIPPRPIQLKKNNGRECRRGKTETETFLTVLLFLFSFSHSLNWFETLFTV